MILGSHVSFRSSDQLVGSVKETISYGANTFMFYTGAPQNTKRCKIDSNLTEEAKKIMQENNIDINNVIVHAPYIINLANNEKEDAYRFSIDFLKEEVKRVEELGINKLVIHPGSSVKLEKKVGIENIINALNEVIREEQNVVICLETMAGKGTELNTNLDELKTIIDGVKYKDKIGVCLDTCHLNDAGYDMSNFDSFLEVFDKKIGFDYIKVIHINDSKNTIAAHKDRHENFGYGFIGFDSLINIIYNPKLSSIPMILETPYTGKSKDSKERLYPPYKFEIEMIKNKKFNENLYEDIYNYYK